MPTIDELRGALCAVGNERREARDRLRALVTSRRPAASAHRLDTRDLKPRQAPAQEEVVERSEGATPRPRLETGSRERRLFAGLVGTLKQSKSNLEEKERDLLEKRKSIEAAVTGKSEEISRELRELQYKAFIEKREEEEKKKFEIDLKYKETERELIEAEYNIMKSAVSDGGILTVTEPVIVYKRARQTEEDAAMSRESEGRLESWRTAQLERIENAIALIHKRRSDTIERRAKAKARGEEDHEDVDIADVEEELVDFDEMATDAAVA